MATVPQSQNHAQCFARRHMSPGDYAYYSYALAVSRGSGIFYSDDRRDSQEFGRDGVSKNTITESRRRLERDGWLVRRQTGRRLKRNPLTGVFESIQYSVTAHGEWITTHPGQCRFTRPDPNIGTGPVPDVGTGEGKPVPDSDFTGPKKDSHQSQILDSPVPDSGAKSSKESKEERAHEKREGKEVGAPGIYTSAGATALKSKIQSDFETRKRQLVERFHEMVLDDQKKLPLEVHFHILKEGANLLGLSLPEINALWKHALTTVPNRQPEPEQEPEDYPADKYQIKNLRDHAKARGMDATELRAYVWKTFRVSSPTHMSLTQYFAVMKYVVTLPKVH